MPLASPGLAPARVLTEQRADGSLVLTSPHPIGDVPRHLVDRLRHWATIAPERVFLADRTGAVLDGEPNAWRRVTYGQARTLVDRLATGLLARGLDAERPLLVLGENGVDHALLALAAMTAGVPVAPVSTAYSLVSSDLAKLRAIAALTTPGLVWAPDASRYGRALATFAGSAPVVVSRGASGEMLPLDALLEREPTAELEDRFAAQTPDAVAKVLFTSGSTGAPKGVINTQRMLCSNQAAILAAWPFLAERPPVILDWLPWSHTFGGNHNFNMALHNGGSLYVDDGKPTPELVLRTLANLRDVSPTLYFNVPRGFDMLVPHLEQDATLRDALFRELDLLFYAAASLPGPLWSRLEALSVAARGEVVLMLSAWGSTETSPVATTVHYRIRRAGVIGLPAPGTAIKLAPVRDGEPGRGSPNPSGAGKLELRVKGPGVTPGYFRQPELTRGAFDEDGFFRMGDAGRLVDPANPAAGIAFDGRIAEDFKLASGTWVHASALRAAVVAAGAPYVQDVVVAGLDREEVGVLVFLNPVACRDLSDAEVRRLLGDAIRAHNATHTGSSQRVARALVLVEAPSIDANEITDKGYINQRAVLERRAAEVTRLYGDAPEVIVARGAAEGARA